MQTILITGSNGFIGSHLTRLLIKEGFDVVATRRTHSNLDKCTDFAAQIKWINTDLPDWTELVKKIQPQVLIHTAWGGVSAQDRNDWDIQLSNFHFSKQLFDSVLDHNDCKIIVLGSQAEYGVYSGRIAEDYCPQPADAYGSVKLLTLHYLQSMKKEGEPWYWLRVFSAFGFGENTSWLMPQVIKKLTNNESIDLTKGEQCYDYMYIDDFVANFKKVLTIENKESGIYNFCSGKAIQVKALLLLLAKECKVSSNLLHFGVIPYRAVQSMYMEGDNTKFCATFGSITSRRLEQAMHEYVEIYNKEKL